MKGACPICGESKANLWDHLTRIHAMKGIERQKWMDHVKNHQQFQTKILPGGLKKEKCESFHLKHPFTCMVSGMTGCGKTTWVQRLLENRGHTIRAMPQRIIWFYSIWQPAYAEMMQTIPDIEFVRGIPSTIDNDGYFDVNMRNLVVIDDQMSTASNNKQVIKLFTQGSHHRNLSVIYLVQNLFHQGKGNRDISLNCHYLVIFNNPRDKLQVLTLAKQMYPRKTNYFLQKYEEAVSRPFGYLFIDLKTSTPDHCRLRTNVLLEDKSSDENDISQELSKYLKQQNASVSPANAKLRSLQHQMGDILKNDSLNNDLKVRTYSQVLNNFLQYKKKIPPAFPRPENQTEQPIMLHDDLEDAEQPAESENAVAEELPSPLSTPAHYIYTPASGSTFHGPPEMLTPPPTVSPLQESEKPETAMKNYLDIDSHTSIGPYSTSRKVRRSRRIKSIRNTNHPYKL